MADIVERLRSWTVDWDGSQMSGGESPRDGFHCDLLRDAADEIERLRTGLRHAIQAAKLALFVIHKQGVMPNSSWEGGFKGDLAAAESAISSGQHAGK